MALVLMAEIERAKSEWLFVMQGAPEERLPTPVLHHVNGSGQRPNQEAQRAFLVLRQIYDNYIFGGD